MITIYNFIKRIKSNDKDIENIEVDKLIDLINLENTVNKISEELKNKLFYKAILKNFSGWNDPEFIKNDWQEYFQSHLEKGTEDKSNIIDLINFLIFKWHYLDNNADR